MALKKSKQINSVVNAEYWNIQTFNYDKPTQTLAVGLHLYINQDSKNAGDKPVEKAFLQINDIEPITSNPFSAIYGLLKEDVTVMPVLVSEEVPEVTENDPETGELIVVTPKVEAVYKSFFADSIDC